MPRHSRSPSPRRSDYERSKQHYDARDRRRDSRDRYGEDERRDSRVELNSFEGHDRGTGRQSDVDRTREAKRGGDSDRRRDRDDRRRHRSPSDDEPLLDLRRLGVSKIHEDDYFEVESSTYQESQNSLKSGEFKFWLKDSRGKYLDELSSESAHRYFRKFVRRWNDGALKEKYYFPPKSGSSSSQTGYKWTFKSHSDAPPNTRRDVDDAEWQEKAPPAPSARADASSDEEIGPTLPSARRAAPTTADLQIAKEDAADRRRLERKAERRDAYNRANDEVPRAVGKEGKMQEKRAANEENKKYREKDATEGLEADEGTLMGDSGSFAAALRARDGAAAKRLERKEASMADKAALDRERLAERREKDSQTMDMFRALAKQRFG